MQIHSAHTVEPHSVSSGLSSNSRQTGRWLECGVLAGVWCAGWSVVCWLECGVLAGSVVCWLEV